MAKAHNILGKIVFYPYLVLTKVEVISENEFTKWKANYNEAFLKFPGGIVEWQAFALVSGLTVAPVSLIYFNLEISNLDSILGYVLFIVPIFLLLYFMIYFKHIRELTKMINEIKVNYYI